jgi:DNA (cytosine-5)-methyltransferase 1
MRLLEVRTNDSQKENHNELHLFAGSGGGILGGILLGHTPVCAVEINPYCRKVLLQRQRDGILPPFPIWDDVATFDGTPWRGIVRTVCGGFPCQDISAAGKGAGITGERSGLWKEMRRVVGEIRPEYIFVENSPMLTVRGLGVVVGDLAELGYDAQWGVLGAAHAGAQHLRKRIWILAHASGVRWGRWGHLSEQEWQRIQSARLVGKSGPWETSAAEKARILGMGDGVANGLDRIRATGNGQVPAVAALAWRTLHAQLMTSNADLRQDAGSAASQPKETTDEK